MKQRRRRRRRTKHCERKEIGCKIERDRRCENRRRRN